MSEDRSRFNVCEVRNPPRHRPPCAYFVDDYYRREVHELRERYNLLERIDGAPDRMQAVLRLSNWLGGINTFGSPPEEVPINAPDVLDCILNKGYRFECSYMPTVFAQTAHAVGYGVRSLALCYDGETLNRCGHHGSSEVWIDGLDKWVYIDALHRLHFERDGVPMGVLEIHNAAYDGCVEGVNIVIGEDRRTMPMTTDTSAAALEEVQRQYREGEIPGPHPTPGLFFWFLVNMHNAYFANLHHNPESYGRVLFYRDRHNAEKTWFQRLHADKSIKTYHWVYWATDAQEVWSPYQLNFPLNQVHVDWEPTGADALRLSFETTCPNFAHYRIELDNAGRAVEHSTTHYTWRLHPGENRCRIRAVNLFGVHGTPSELTVSL